MFVGLFRNIFSMNSVTNFEQARKKVTYHGDYYPPSEQALVSVLLTLKGQDPETKPSVAFGTIVSKMACSDSIKYWNYMVKNLIVLDRTVEENLFLHDIANLDIPTVQNYRSQVEKYTKRKLDDLIKLYYQYIKEKAHVYEDRTCSIHVPIHKMKEHFLKMPPRKILEENKKLSLLCMRSIEIMKTGYDGHLKYHLTQYVFLLILYSMLKILSVQYSSFIGLAQKYFEMEKDIAKDAFNFVSNFLKQTDDLISILAHFQFIPGFQISLYEIRNPKVDQRLIKAMEEYLMLVSQQNKHVDRRKLTLNFLQIKPEEFLNSKDFTANLRLSLARLNSMPSQVSSSQASELKLESTSEKNKKEEEYEEEDDEEEKTVDFTPDVEVSSGMSSSLHPLFLKSFHSGFKSPIVIGEHNWMEDTEEKDLQKSVNPQFADSKWLADHRLKGLTPLFFQLLEIDKEDDLFANWKNCSSHEYNPDIAAHYDNSQIRRLKLQRFELNPLALVTNDCEENTRMRQSIIFQSDFDDGLFENFKNTFSHDTQNNSSFVMS